MLGGHIAAHKQMIKGERNEGNQNYYKMQPLVQVINLKEVGYTKECYFEKQLQCHDNGRFGRINVVK